MSTYEELHGKRVEVFSSDPTLDSSYEGQVWYNSTSGVLKSVVLTEATHSGPAMPNKKSLFGGGVGTSTAGLTVGGIDDSSYLNTVEEWNGSGWAAGGTYPTSRYSAGTAGTQTAAMAYCGRVPGSPGGPTETYEYDGSSWTSGNSFPTPGNSMQGIGSVDTAVVSTEVYTSTNMHHWNGTSWTSANARNTAKGGQAAFGSQTAAVLAGGFPDNSNITELYDGTNWTSGNTMNTGRQQVAGSGTQTSGVAFGGDRPPSEAAQTTIESWDGTSWATSPATLATARARAGAGRNTAAGTWIAGGIGPNGGGEGFDATEIYENSINTVTAAAWASGGAMTTARTGLASAGTQTANVFIGGQMSNSPFAPLNTVELYNGTTWSSNPNNAPYSASNNCGTGTQTAALSWGGYPNVTTTLEFDGSAFSTGGSLSTGRELTSNNIGVQTAAVAASGFQRPGTYPTQSEEYNGTAWTAGGAVNTPRYSAAGAGTETASVISGGIEPGQLSATEEYNGSSWTTVNARPYAGGNAGTSGTQTDSLVYGGNPGGALTTTLGYDGTNWSTRPSMSQSRAMMGSSAGGTSTAALASSGAAPTATEEFTGETTALNVKTLTQS